MPTPAYTPLDRNAPDGGSGTGTTFAAATLANMRALADAIVLGRSPGWTQARSGGTANQPGVIIYSNGTLALRVTFTWTGFNPTTLAYDWSNDTGATWATIGTSAVLTFDGSQNVTANTNSGGFVTLVMEIWAKVLKATSDVAAHIAATGTAVHGLGTAALANLTNMIITGGSINNVIIGATTPKDGDFTRVREDFHDYGAIAAGGTVTLELDKYAAFAFSPHATETNAVSVAVSGAPTAGKFQSWQLEILDGHRTTDGLITYPAAAKWIGGSGTRPLDTSLETGAAARNVFALSTRDGGTRIEITHLGKGAT